MQIRYDLWSSYRDILMTKERVLISKKSLISPKVGIIELCNPSQVALGGSDVVGKL